MFSFIGSLFSDNPVTVTDCDNIQYTPAGNGSDIVVDDPEDTFSGVVQFDSLPVDIQEAIESAVDSATPI